MARKLLFLFRPDPVAVAGGHTGREKAAVTHKTSQTDPLRIATVEVGEGAVGLTLCPGKKGDSLFGRPWNRDLATDVEAIRAWGARVVVTLIEEHEFHDLSVTDLGETVQAAGIEWLHWPIKDVNVPDRRFEDAWLETGSALCARIVAGDRVLVHCKGGLGRAGTVAARLLIECGIEPADAVIRVRAERPGAIETPGQLEWVLRQRPARGSRQPD